MSVLRDALHDEEKMDWYIGSSRRAPLRVIEDCIAAGWMYELVDSVVIQDGDGFTKQPERWRTGYELSRRGRELAKEHRAKEQADFKKRFEEAPVAEALP